MRISDASSDVCSSDLVAPNPGLEHARPVRTDAGNELPGPRADALRQVGPPVRGGQVLRLQRHRRHAGADLLLRRRDLLAQGPSDRKTAVEGKSVSGRVDLGGRRVLKTKHVQNT